MSLSCIFEQMYNSRLQLKQKINEQNERKTKHNKAEQQTPENTNLHTAANFESVQFGDTPERKSD